MQIESVSSTNEVLGAPLAPRTGPPSIGSSAHETMSADQLANVISSEPDNQKVYQAFRQYATQHPTNPGIKLPDGKMYFAGYDAHSSNLTVYGSNAGHHTDGKPT